MPLDLSQAEPVADAGKLDLSRAEPIAAPSAKPQGFWEEFKQALSEIDMNHNMFMRMGEINSQYSKIAEELKDTPEYKTELARRGGGEYSMMSWLNDHIGPEYEKRHAQPDKIDQPLGERLRSMVQAASDHPGAFVGEMVKGAIEDPELLLAGQWEIGLAKAAANMGKIAGAAARTAEVAGEAGAMGAAISATQQYQEGGKVDPKETAIEAAAMAIPVAALHAAVRLGLGSVAKTEKAPAREQLKAETEAVDAVQTKVQAGLTPDEALDQVLRAAGVAEDDAAQITKGTRDAIDRQRPEDQVSDAEGVREGEGNKGVLREPEQGIDQGNASRPAEEGVTKEQGTKYANSIANQSGKIDQRLLSAMGFVGLTTAGTYALTGDGEKAAQAAMAAGATVAALAVANKVGLGVRSIFEKYAEDKRIIPMDPFRRFFSSGQQMAGAVDNWTRTTDALLLKEPNKDVSRTKVRDYVQGYRDMQLTPGEQAYAEAVQKFLDKMGGLAKDDKVIKQLREDYLTGIYQKKPFAAWKDILSELATDEAYRGNYPGMSPKSRHGLQKVIPDYRTAEALHEQGLFPLIPLTNDPVKIAAHYARSVQKSIAVKNLIDDLKRTPSERTYANGHPIPILVGDTPDAAIARIVQGNAIAARKLDLTPEQVKTMNKFQIMDAPHDYVPIQHPSLEGLRAHRDVAPMLKMVFDTSDPSRAAQALYGASMAAKGLFFTVSIFHPYALLDVAGAVALPRAKFLLSLPKYYQSIPQARAMLKNSSGAPGIKRAADAGLTILRSPSDVDPTFLERTFNYMGDLAGTAANKASFGYVQRSVGNMPFQAMKFMHGWFHHFLWDEVFPTLKLAAFNAETTNYGIKNPKADMAASDRQIAKATNDLFGGQNWFELANTVPSQIGRTFAMGLLTPSARRLQQTLFLSPDWNVSAQRAWYEGFKSVLPGIDRKASDSMYRGYLVWSALTYVGAANLLANAWTGKNIWDQKDWTYVDRGDGTKVQLNKHWMEFWHLAHNPVGFAMNKLNLLPKEALNQSLGNEWTGYDPVKRELYGAKFDVTVAGRLAHAGRSVIPISLSQILKDPVNGALSFVTGRPIYGTPFDVRDEVTRQNAIKAGKDPDKAVDTARKRRETQAYKEARP